MVSAMSEANRYEPSVSAEASKGPADRAIDGASEIGTGVVALFQSRCFSAYLSGSFFRPRKSSSAPRATTPRHTPNSSAVGM